MDVLRPELVWVDGRCYRKMYTVEEDEISSRVKPEDDVPGLWDVDEYATCEANVEQTENGFRTAIDVASAYFKYIIGKGGESRRRLEQETKTQIRIPRHGQEGEIVITGVDRHGVQSAHTRIELIVLSARGKQPFTHFLSIPATSETIQNSLYEFRDDVLRNCGDSRGIDETIFQNPAKLHLTIGTLVLLSEGERWKAAEILRTSKEELMSQILNKSPLTVSVDGIEYMNDDPGEVDVLYAKIADPTGKLQALSERLVDKFRSAGLMLNQFEKVKLHITLMNTLFRRDAEELFDEHQSTKRESFDAREVLRMFSDYTFGKMEVTEVHMSQRHSTAEDGYYCPSARIFLK